MNKRFDQPLDDRFRTRWRAAFQRYALLNDDDAGIAGWSTSGLEARVRLFRRCWTSDPAGARWLDIGCGAGTYTRLLRAQGLFVVGIDYSVPTLLKARARGADGIHWLAADVGRLPLEDGVWDGALCFGVLQAVPSSAVALRSIAAALKPGGRLFVDALNGQCIPTRVADFARRRAGKPAHLRYESADSVTETLRECGFDAIRLHWAPILPAKLQRFQRWVEGPPFRAVLRRSRTIAGWVSHSMLIEARRAGAPT